MKRFLLFILFSATYFVVSAQKIETNQIPVKVESENVKVQQNIQAVPVEAAEPVVERTNAKMSFETMVVDYGTIQQKGEPLRTVKFTNTGTDPLIIKSAHGSCGCTVPVWPKDPILPGESSVIEVRYDTNRIGKINKSITITTNEGPEKHILQVVGEVMKVEEENAVPTSTPSVIKG